MQKTRKSGSLASDIISTILILGIIAVLLSSLFYATFQENPDDSIKVLLDQIAYGLIALSGFITVVKIFKPKLYQENAPILLRLTTPIFGRSPLATLEDDINKDGLILTSSAAIPKIVKSKTVICNVDIFDNVRVTGTMHISEDCVEVCDIHDTFVYIDDDKIELIQGKTEYHESLTIVIEIIQKGASAKANSNINTLITSEIKSKSSKLALKYNYKTQKSQNDYTLSVLSKESIDKLTSYVESENKEESLSERLKNRLLTAKQENDSNGIILLLLSHKDETVFDGLISVELAADKNLAANISETHSIFVSHLEKDISLVLAEKLHVIEKGSTNIKSLSYDEFSKLNEKEQRNSLNSTNVFYSVDQNNESTLLANAQRSICIGTCALNKSNVVVSLEHSPASVKKVASCVSFSTSGLFNAKRKCKNFLLLSTISSIIAILGLVAACAFYAYTKEYLIPFIIYLASSVLSFYVVRKASIIIIIFAALACVPFKIFVLDEVIVPKIGTLFAIFFVNNPIFSLIAGSILLASTFYPVKIDYKMAEQLSDTIILSAISVVICMFFQSRIVSFIISKFN